MNGKVMPNMRCRLLAVFIAVILPASLLCAMALDADYAYAGAKKYRIVYVLNDGKQAKKQVKYVKKGKTIQVTSLKKPTKKGYTFKGWYKNKKLTKKAKSVKGTSSKSKRTLYAKWSPKKYKIVYKLNGGKLSGKYAKTYKYGKGAKLPTPKRKGYTFEGWYKNKKLTNKVSKISTRNSGKKTLYAKWKTKRYSIKYNLNGGTLSGSYAKSYRATKAVSLPTPKRKGYAFIGWYTNKKLTKPLNRIEKGTTGNKSLYAKWVKRTVTAHRGYHVGHAQNSIDAYVAAANKGFTYVETDVRFTKDGVAVLVHDATIPVYKQVPVVDEPDEPVEPDEPDEPEPDVEALGDYDDSAELESGSVDDAIEDDGYPEYTASEVRALAEGGTIELWDVSKHTYSEIQNASLAKKPSGPNGTNISTYKDFLKTCAEYNLVPTIDLKAGTKSQIKRLMQWAKDYSLYDKALWGSSSFTIIGYACSYDPHLSIGYYSNSITKKKVQKVKKIQDKGADVRISTHLSKVKSSTIKLCKDAHIPFGLYGLKDETQIASANPYVASFTIDGLVADRVPETI